jgi:hypothetical protein
MRTLYAETHHFSTVSAIAQPKLIETYRKLIDNGNGGTAISQRGIKEIELIQNLLDNFFFNRYHPN